MINEESKEDECKIIKLPTFSTYFTKCCVCRKQGKFEAFTRWVESLAKAYFYCNNCKVHHPQGYNIDIREAPELMDARAIPSGVIEWEKN